MHRKLLNHQFTVYLFDSDVLASFDLKQTFLEGVGVDLSEP